jgi:hypothetical protein
VRTRQAVDIGPNTPHPLRPPQTNPTPVYQPVGTELSLSLLQVLSRATTLYSMAENKEIITAVPTSDTDPSLSAAAEYAKARELGLATAQETAGVGVVVTGKQSKSLWRSVVSFVWDSVDGDPEYRRYVQRLDMFFFPTVCLGYFIKYLDQTNYSMFMPVIIPILPHNTPKSTSYHTRGGSALTMSHKR